MYVSPTIIVWLAIAVAVSSFAAFHTITLWKDRAQGVTDVNRYRDAERRRIQLIDAEIQRAQADLAAERRKLTRQADLLKIILDRTARAYPWAAKIHEDLLVAEADSLSRILAIKKRPALKASKAVREFRKSVTERLKQAKYGQYKALVYENAFPFLIDFIEGAATEELAVAQEPFTDHDDPARHYLSEAEYARLKPAERSKIALQRYVARRKSNWEIGRDYERYIGYRHETDGWDIEFHGAIHGLEDLGRDLIARRNGQTLIIQCKYWAQWRDIHENAVFQLFGSVVDYLFERGLLGSGEDVFNALKMHRVQGLFVTSTSMSDRAQAACRALGIQVNTAVRIDEEYPRIKCNIGQSGKLYHLPFDQQYDRIKINPHKGEFYARTATEAEARGFRRAFRWTPESAG